MFEMMKFAYNNLQRKRMRTLLTIFGIAIGVASVVIIGTIGAIGKSAINDELNQIGLGSIAVSRTEGNYIHNLNNSHLELIENNSDVEKAVPIMMNYTYVRPGTKIIKKCAVWGINDAAKDVISLEVIYGRMISEADVKGAENVCVVDDKYAKSIYKRENIVGKKISILLNGIYREFEIIGIINSGNSMLKGLITDYAPDFIYLPYTVLQKDKKISGFEQIAVKVKEGSDLLAVGENIIKEIEKNSETSGNFRTSNIAKEKEQLNNILDIITIILSAIAGISLIVSGLSIMTVMLVSVSERTREIGIKKSIGAGNADIIVEFIIEAALITTLGCLLGLVAGLLVSFGICFITAQKMAIDFWLIAVCILFSLSIGTIFGVYPAVKAARLNPVDALRTE